MSYLYGQELQVAVYQALINHTELSTVSGGHIYDALPAGIAPETYVLIGEDKTTDRSDMTAKAARIDITLTVVSSSDGFSQAKLIAAEICNALEETPLVLSAGKVAEFQFRSAKTRRDTANLKRRIDLIFRTLIDEE
jgi:hypothetical protein